MSLSASPDAFTIENHGEVTVILTSPVLETMDPSLLEGASSLLIDALKRVSCPQVVVDLSHLQYFGSAFLALLIRCWKLTTTRGGSFVRIARDIASIRCACAARRRRRPRTRMS